jgi:N-acetylglucosamine malate deacetylase 1
LNILVISAHPDDEVLGMGGTIKKLTKSKNNIQLVVVSEGASAQYSDQKMIKIRKEACIKSGNILGIKKIHFLNFPDGKLDSISQLEINIELEKILDKFKPKIVYTVSDHDLSKDHKKVFESTLVATRPISTSVKMVLAYEVPGTTNNPFLSNYYENIEKEFTVKLKAFKEYNSEIEKYPHPRSLESLEILAKKRGIECGLKKVEAFRLIRKIND